MKNSVGKPLGAACAVVLGALLTACSAPAAGQPAAAHPGHAAPPAGEHQGQGAHQGHAAPPASGGKPAVAAGIDQLGAALGCPSPNMQVDAEELRLAACKTSGGQHTLVTFTTGKGQRDWLDAAKPYGGTYLVGQRWVVVAEPPVLEGLRARLGGEIEVGGRHH